MQSNNKQRLVMILTILAFVFLGWQVYGLVNGQNTVGQIVWGREDNSNIQAVPFTQKDPNKVQASTLVAPTTLDDIPKQVLLTKPQLLTNQNIYMRMLNQFELAKMQRRLLEEEVGIASAHSRIAQYNDKILKLNGGKLSMTDSFSSTHSDKISLAYVEKLHGQWTATINMNGDFESVHPGSRLADGREVVAINNEGLTFEKNNQTQALTFIGLQPFKAASVEVVPSPSSGEPVAVSPSPSSGESVAVSPSPSSGESVAVSPSSSEPVAAEQKKIIDASKTAQVDEAVSTQPAQSVVAVEKPAPDKATAIAKHVLVANGLMKKNNQIKVESSDQDSVIAHADEKPSSVVATSSEQTVSSEQTASSEQTVSSEQKVSSEGVTALSEPKTVSENPSQSDEDQLTKSSALPTSVVEQSSPANMAVVLDQKQQDQLKQVKSQLLAEKQGAPREYTKTEHEFLAASSKAYTIQLIGSRDPAQLAQFIFANNLNEGAKIFHTYYLGSDWFVLAYGVYDTRKAAYGALAKMEQSVRDTHPWIRRLAGVQRAIQKKS